MVNIYLYRPKATSTRWRFQRRLLAFSDNLESHTIRGDSQISADKRVSHSKTHVILRRCLRASTFCYVQIQQWHSINHYWQVASRLHMFSVDEIRYPLIFPQTNTNLLVLYTIEVRNLHFQYKKECISIWLLIYSNILPMGLPTSIMLKLML